MPNELLAIGRVEALCINGELVDEILFRFEGPKGDKHFGFTRKLSGHDTQYLRSSALKKGDEVANHRQWSALAYEEVVEIEAAIDAKIPCGALLENIVFSGIPHFSQLPPQTRFVFPDRDAIAHLSHYRQAVLIVREANSPCSVVGNRVADVHGRPELMARFVRYAMGKRGLVGNVHAPGRVKRGDTVLVYPPVE